MIIITNFKAYHASLGKNALALAELHEKIAKETGVQFAVAPSILDLEKVCHAFPELPVFAQHVDDADHGAFTGKIPPAYVKSLGAFGTLLNHSEHRIEPEKLIKKCLKAKEAGLKTALCVENIEEAIYLNERCAPDFISLEPRELIGGNVSVSNANPELIESAVHIFGRNKVIVGAGVKNAEDVRIAKKLGACGILLASGVIKSENPEAVLRDLAKGAL